MHRYPQKYKTERAEKIHDSKKKKKTVVSLNTFSDNTALLVLYKMLLEPLCITNVNVLSPSPPPVGLMTACFHNTTKISHGVIHSL